MAVDIHDLLKRYWNYSSFRPLQEEIIRSVLNGKDTLALLPTGGGKSICFQVPALVKPGLCLVISPLIALMKDQVDALKKKDIPALLIHSGMQRRDVIRTLQNATHDYFKFLYVSPERLETSLFREYLPALNINLIAVDEAHCISQWGYDFRPSYLRIAELRKELPGIPVLALTATATKEVQEDICEKLAFPSHLIFRQSFERKNLSFSCLHTTVKLSKLVSILEKVQGSAIIYCRSRRRTVEIANVLDIHGIMAQAYHAGLPSSERQQRQQDWITNKFRVMVSTNAFGMGIDKPDVRLVIHADAPDCLENYYQEAGRAGRDGKKAYAVLLYDDKDIDQLHREPDLRYPSLDQIKTIYKALVNYLQIPVNTGQDQRYRFHFTRFIHNFKLNGHETLYCIKALEQDGWLEFNEQSFAPSTIEFITDKRGLYTFQSSHPEYEMLLTTLLRTYEGIFDFPVFISELSIAKDLRKEELMIVEDLKKIASFGIIKYNPRHDDPVILFKKNRVKAEELRFDLSSYLKRKETYVRRTKKMTEYLNLGKCRSRFIITYFGDPAAGDCGVCDNCLKHKSRELTSTDFSTIHNEIMKLLQHNALNSGELFQKLDSYPSEHIEKVILFLQKENRLTYNSRGELMLT